MVFEGLFAKDPRCGGEALVFGNLHATRRFSKTGHPVGRCASARLRALGRALDSVVDSLSAVWSRLSVDVAYSILPSDVACLLELFPVLGRVPAVADAPHTDLPVDPKERRSRALSSLREVLLRLASRHPVVLFIDDFQWTDPESHVLLTDLLRPPRAPKIYVVLAQRDVTLEELGPTDRTIAALGDAVRPMTLGPLSSEDTRQLCKMQMSEADDWCIEHVVSEAGGSPMFASELVVFLQSCSSPSSQPTLTQAILRRFEQSTPEVQLVAKLVAISPEPLRVDVLCSATRLERGEVAKAVGIARSARFVKSSKGCDLRVLEPYHDQTRFAIKSALLEAEHPGLNSRLALAYRALGVANHQVIGWHYEKAGQRQRAAEAYVRAAKQAERRNDYLFAAEAYLSARLMSDGEAAAELEWKRAECLATAGRDFEAATVGQSVLSSGEDSSRAIVVASWYGNGGDLPKALALGRPALARLGWGPKKSQLAACLERIDIMRREPSEIPSPQRLPSNRDSIGGDTDEHVRALGA